MEIMSFFAQDAQGNIMPSAECYLYAPGTTNLVSGLVDINGMPISNPFQASNIGQVQFGAPNGVYDLRIKKGVRDTTIRIQCADIVQAMGVVDSILGSHPSNPSTRNDGTPLQQGDDVWNSTDKIPYWWTGSSWSSMDNSVRLLEQSLAGDAGASIVGYTFPNTYASPYTVEERLNTVVHVMDFLTDAQRAAVEAGQVVDCGPQLQRAIDAAGHGVLNWPGGALFGTGQELIVRYCQRWTGGGRGKRLYPFLALNNFNTAIITTGDGTAYKTVKTRRGYRGNSNDAQDAPMSAIVNVQFQNFDMGDIAVHCWYDPERIQTERLYLGHDWDTGVFVGCRLHCKINQVAVTGCYRVAAVYMDVTRGVGLPELIGWDGVRHPEDTQYGGDGCTLNELITWGGRWGLVVLGAKPKEGFISYGKDYKESLSITITNTPVSGTVTLGGEVFTWSAEATGLRQVQLADTAHECAENLCRAAEELYDSDADATRFRTALFLANDATVNVVARNANTTDFKNTFTAAITGNNVFLSSPTPVTSEDPAPYFDQELQQSIPDTRGSYGFSDFTITNSQLFGSEHPTRTARVKPRADLNHLLDDGAGSFWIDGLAGNAVRKLQGHRYFNVRFDGSYDPFNVKLGRTHRDEFFGCHWDGTGTTGYFWPDGSSAGKNVRAFKYGPTTNIPMITTLTRFYSRDSTPYTNYFTYNNGTGSIMDGSSRTILPGDTTILKGVLNVFNNKSQSSNAEILINSGTAGSGTIRWRMGGTNLTLASLRRNNATGILQLSNSGGYSQSCDYFNVTASGVGLPSTITSGGELNLSGSPDPASGSLFRIRNVGTSALRMSATEMITYMSVRPTTPNTYTLGGGGFTWANIYTANPVTVTSDARLKTPIRTIGEREMAAGRKLVRAIGIYQWLASVEEKGPDRARLHVGQTVQGAIAILESEGLIASRYGFVCYDEWEDDFDEGKLQLAAGSKYGFREGPMQNLMLRAMAAELDELAVRVTNLERRD